LLLGFAIWFVMRVIFFGIIPWIVAGFRSEE